MYINSPNIFHIGTRVLVFSGENQVTARDIMMADVAIFIKNDHFLIVKDRYKEPTKEKFKLFLLADTLNYYYKQIKLRLTEQIGENQFSNKIVKINLNGDEYWYKIGRTRSCHPVWENFIWQNNKTEEINL